MQYQLILFLLNLCLLTLVYFVMKNSPRQRKLVFLTTIYAYFLSVLLPYLLLWIPPKWLIFSYIIAIAVALWVIDMLLSEPEDSSTPLGDEKTELTNKIDLKESIGSLRQNFSTATLATNRIDMIETLDHREILRKDPVRVAAAELETKMETLSNKITNLKESLAFDTAVLSETRKENSNIVAENPKESETVMSETSKVEAREPEISELAAASDSSLPEETQVDQVVDSQLPDEFDQVEPVEPEIEEINESVEIELPTEPIPSDQTEPLDTEAEAIGESVEIELPPEQIPSHEGDAQKAIETIDVISIETETANITDEQPETLDESAGDLLETTAEGNDTSDQPLETGAQEIMDDTEPEAQTPSDEIQVPSLEGLDIEALIELGFEAKFKDEYAAAIQIFEYLLGKNPPVKVAALVLDDIEVMRTKLV